MDAITVMKWNIVTLPKELGERKHSICNYDNLGKVNGNDYNSMACS